MQGGWTVLDRIPVLWEPQPSLKVQEVAIEVEQIVKVLEGEGQSIWTIARACHSHEIRLPSYFVLPI